MQVNFWRARNGAFLSHSKGLSPEQVQFLASLRPGDRLVVYMNEPDPDGNAADLTMKKAIPYPNERGR